MPLCTTTVHTMAHEQSTSGDRLLSSTDRGSVARASSVLQRNAKMYGPMNALNSNSSTCWNSEGSSGTEMEQQWIQVDFKGQSACPRKIGVQFQPGFSAETGTIELLNKAENGQWETIASEDVEWEDVHQLQFYELPPSTTKNCLAVKLVWEDDFADLYGRIIIYQLQIWGSEA